MRRHWLGLVLATFLAWDYAPTPELSMFLLYARTPEGRFDVDRPLYPVRVTDPLTLEVRCTVLPLSGPGPWVVAVLAMSRTGERSGFSDEISFRWDRQEGCVDVILLPPEAPRPPLPPIPPLVPPPPVPPLSPPIVLNPPRPSSPSTPPAAGGSDTDITKTCAWTGCDHPRPATPPPRAGWLTDAPAWSGK